MKKLVLLLAVVFSVSLCSCGNSNKAEEATAPEVAEPVEAVEEVVEAVVDTTAADTTVVVEGAAEAAVAE